MKDKITLTKEQLSEIIAEAIEKDRKNRNESKPTKIEINHKIDPVSYINKKLWDEVFK